MSGRPRHWVYALAAAGILIFAGFGGSSAFSASSSSSGASTPGASSDLKGKKLAYVACSDLNRWCREFRHTILDALKAKGHRLSVARPWSLGSNAAILIDWKTGMLRAGADPRVDAYAWAK